MGRLYLAGIMITMLTPVLLVSAIANLTRKQAVTLGILASLGAGLIVLYNTDAYSNLAWRWGAPPMPADQIQFVAAINKIRADAAEQQDERQLEFLRRELCKTLVDAAGWTGKIANAFDSNVSRKRVILVNISPHIVVRTEFSGDQTGTLIHPGSALYPAAAGLSAGDQVRFSGSFVTDFRSCGRSQSTQDALQEPNFVFRFSDIRKYEVR